MQLGRVIVDTRKLEEIADFCRRHFGFECRRTEGDRIVELVAQGHGIDIVRHAMPAGRREGQNLVKLVFDVEDVEEFCRASENLGLRFGPIHRADGYRFANAKDPAKNPIPVSSRAFVDPSAWTRRQVRTGARKLEPRRALNQLVHEGAETGRIC